MQRDCKAIRIILKLFSLHFNYYVQSYFIFTNNKRLILLWNRIDKDIIAIWYRFEHDGMGRDDINRYISLDCLLVIKIRGWLIRLHKLAISSIDNEVTTIKSNLLVHQAWPVFVFRHLCSATKHRVLSTSLRSRLWQTLNGIGLHKLLYGVPKTSIFLFFNNSDNDY